MRLNGVVLAWSLTHFACAFIKPDIVKTMFGRRVKPWQTIIALLLLGSATAFSIVVNVPAFYFILGVFELVSSVATYSHGIEWNVSENGQLTMGILEFVAATALISKIW